MLINRKNLETFACVTNIAKCVSFKTKSIQLYSITKIELYENMRHKPSVPRLSISSLMTLRSSSNSFTLMSKASFSYFRVSHLSSAISLSRVNISIVSPTSWNSSSFDLYCSSVSSAFFCADCKSFCSSLTLAEKIGYQVHKNNC